MLNHGTAVLLFVGMLLTTDVSAARPTVQQVNRALDIAERAASAQLYDLSLRAYVEALRQGPPSNGDSGDRLDGRFRGARVDTTSPLPPTPVQAVRTRAITLAEKLYPKWKEHLGADKALDGVRHIVFPLNSPRVHPWWDAADAKGDLDLHRGRGLVEVLFVAAVDANGLEQLHAEAQRRAADGSLLAASIALLCCSDDQQRLSAIKTLHSTAENGPARQDVQFVASCLGQADVRNQSQRAEVAAAWHALAVQCRLWNGAEDTFVPALLLRAARENFSVGRNDRAVELLEILHSVSKPGRVITLEKARDVIGTELLVRGLVAETELVLGAELATEFQGRYRNSGLLAGRKFTRAAVIADDQELPEVVIAGSVADEEAAGRVWVSVLDLSTNTSRNLFVLPEFSQIGSLSISPDGTELLLHATSPGEPVSSAQMYCIRMDDGTIRSLGRGIYPAWSPKGRRIVYSSYSPARGVWVMRRDGSDRQLLDPDGWSAAWSPSGRFIAWVRNQTSNYGLVVYDLAEEKLNRPALQLPSEFPFLSAGMQWSADGQHLFVRGWRSQGGQGVLDFQLSGRPGVSVRYRNANGFPERLGSVAQAPVLSVGVSGVETLHLLDKDGELVKLNGQWEGRRNASPCSRDGKQLFYVSRPVRRGGQ